MGYLFNFLGHLSDGKLWAIQPTADEYARHWLGLDGFAGEDVYRLGSDVNLGEYAPADFSLAAGMSKSVTPSSVALGAALVNYELGTLSPGGLTDAFLYGSLNRVQFLGGGMVQLQPDVFNFNSEQGRPFRNLMTEIQHQTIAGGGQGTNFRTIFVGPTKSPDLH